MRLAAERAAGPATTAMMLVGICLLITALPSGWLADRVAKKVLVAISSALATAGRYLGLSNLASAEAGAIGAYVGGPIADHLGYVPLFGIYGTLFLLSALALVGIREERPTARGLQSPQALSDL